MSDTKILCTKCGRPMVYCNGHCEPPKPTKPERKKHKCSKCDMCINGCNFSVGEYCKRVTGRIVETDESCAAQATIPINTIDRIEDLNKFANGFVHVTTNNTIYYIDDKHRIAQTWAGIVEKDSYDIIENNLNLRSQLLFTNISDDYGQTASVMVFFDKKGKAHIL